MLLHFPEMLLLVVEVADDVMLSFSVHPGPCLIGQPSALLGHVWLSCEEVRLGVHLALGPCLAVVFNVHLVDVEGPELVGYFLLSSLSDQYAACLWVEQHCFIDAFLFFVRLCVNFSLGETASSDDLENIRKIAWLDPPALVALQHFPELLK